MLHHSSGKIKDVKHPAGIVTGFTLHYLIVILGLTMIDFIVLPPRARLCFTYNGDADVEAFFGIRRM